MKKFRTLLCILLAVAMVLSFAACGKKADDNAPADDAADNKPADDANKPADDANKPADDANEPADDANEPADDANEPADDGEDAPPADDGNEEPPYAEGEGPDPDLELTPLIMMNDIEEYFNRPHEIQAGSKVTIAATADVPAYTPWNATAEPWLMNNIYEGLLYRYMGQSGEIRGLIAESWEHSDDFLTWTFQIRDGITFTDGTVCDAAAIAKSYDFYYETSGASFNNVNLVGWEATGDMELTLTLSAPCPYFENSLSELYIVSPTAMEQYGANDNRAAIGTAPYYVESYTSGVGFILKANPNYYLYERMPVIETVEAKIIGDENTKLMAMLNGELDIYAFSSVESYYNLQDYGYEGTILKGNGNSSPLFFNAKAVPEFRIYEVRKAMNRFIDLEGLNEIMYDGMGLVQTSLWTVGSSGEVPWPEGFYYDFDEGMELMGQAGIDPASMKFNAKIIESGADTFVTIQGFLAKAGITMEVEPLEAAANFTFLMNGEWTITAGNSGYMDSAPYGPWNFILKPEHLIKEVWCDIYDPELYQLMLDTHEKMSSALSWDEMVEHCRELTRLEQEDYGAMPGVQSAYFVAINPELKGATFITENHAIQMYYMYY